MQLDRALDYESRGLGFETSRARQFLFTTSTYLLSNIMVLFSY